MADAPTPQGSDTPALPEPVAVVGQSKSGAVGVRYLPALYRLGEDTYLYSQVTVRALMVERDAAKKLYEGCKQLLVAVENQRDAGRIEHEAAQQAGLEFRALLLASTREAAAREAAALMAERDALRREVEARKPLTPEQCEALYEKASAEAVYRCRHDYYAGILDAEHAHGILPAPPSADGGAT